MSEKPEDIPSCSPEYGTNPAYTDACEALAEAQAALEAIKATLDDAKSKEEKRQEMSANCKAARASVESIGNTVRAPKNWEEFELCEKCINETYATALGDFITAAESEYAACETAVQQAQAKVNSTPKIICVACC